MKPFTTLTAIAAPLLRDNVDTDAIIPSREMRSVSKKGLADGLFAGWRYVAIGSREPQRDFVLNRPRYAGARILVSGANFGCGSSREHAVWALAEFGIRAVVAPSFNPIFQANCIANGVVPVLLDRDVVATIAAALEESASPHLTVDLDTQAVSLDHARACVSRSTVRCGGLAFRDRSRCARNLAGRTRFDRADAPARRSNRRVPRARCRRARVDLYLRRANRPGDHRRSLVMSRSR
jgi:3-isopropylmalate/(R)-2-methylmalate dehydratase small subunit